MNESQTAVNKDYKNRYSLVNLAVATHTNPAALVAVMMEYITQHEKDEEYVKHVFGSTIVFEKKDGIPHKAITILPSPIGNQVIDFTFNEAVQQDLLKLINENIQRHKK